MRQTLKYLDELEITEEMFTVRKYHPNQQTQDYEITLFELGKYDEVQLSEQTLT